MNLSFSLLLLVLPLISHCDVVIDESVADVKINSTECSANSDCSHDKACYNLKCINICAGACGENTACRMKNHVPTCDCLNDHVGDPFIRCSPIQPLPVNLDRLDPCLPSPCGSHANCQEINGSAFCLCLPTYEGTPPNCQLKCIMNSDCPSDESCINRKCQDPCKQVCGIGAECKVVNYNPICSCPQGYGGDPFIQCLEHQPELDVPDLSKDDSADPCIDICGQNAKCSSLEKGLICSCLPGFTGNPYIICNEIPSSPPIEEVTEQIIRLDSCNPTPCGLYSQCELINGSASCSCLPTYDGAPPNCHLKCSNGLDCPKTESCINEKCTDPCINLCGIDGDCRVINHQPICACLNGKTGNAVVQCMTLEATQPDIKIGNNDNSE